ncbi:MAG: hypothetical protein MRJ65_01445 [Candidatus Brocadiaceae bacterium]|nr:hypothetical protein [Candidatus Brocadiaceae bacterium]
MLSISEFIKDFICTCVLELIYTSYDLKPFAQDMGYEGEPFTWDEERRLLLKCEIDAVYAHLYEVTIDEFDYIMETFPIVKRRISKNTANSTQSG